MVSPKLEKGRWSIKTNLQMHCGGFSPRQGGSATNQIEAEALAPNGCTSTINDGGTFTTGNVVVDIAL
jgi:hypothetical protein